MENPEKVSSCLVNICESLHVIIFSGLSSLHLAGPGLVRAAAHACSS